MSCLLFVNKFNESDLNLSIIRVFGCFSSRSNSNGWSGGHVPFFIKKALNGEDIIIRVAFKPPATIMKEQNTINENLEDVVLEGKGRHDPCVGIRAVPVGEAMMATTLADHCLRFL